MIKNITNLGDAAVYCDFGNQIDQETNLNVIKYFKNLRELKDKGITNLKQIKNQNYDDLENKLIEIFKTNLKNLIF